MFRSKLITLQDVRSTDAWKKIAFIRHFKLLIKCIVSYVITLGSVFLLIFNIEFSFCCCYIQYFDFVDRYGDRYGKCQQPESSFGCTRPMWSMWLQVAKSGSRIEI